MKKRVVNVSHLTFLSPSPLPPPPAGGQAEGMNGVEGTIFTLMAAYVVFIDTAGSALVVVGGGAPRRPLAGGGYGKRRGGEGCLRVGRGRERGAWGLRGGRQEQYCSTSTPGARCQPEQKGRVSNSGGV